MSRIEEILSEYVAFVDLSEETRREIVRRLEKLVIESVESWRRATTNER